MNITRRQCLQAALVVIGLVFLSLPILMAVWPSGWIWLPRQTEYEQMMIGVYGMAFMEQLAPSYKEVNHCIDAICSSLRISVDDLLTSHNPVIVNTGNSFLIVPLKDEKAILDAHADLDEIQRISEEFDLIGYYIFSQKTRVPGRDAATRMFAPRYGISEESATGMAAGPLACYLYDKMGINKDTFLIEQGHLMEPPSPSVIKVQLKLKDKKIFRLIAGGKAKVMKSIII